MAVAKDGPVFLHRGMRTGGTALVQALEQVEHLGVVYGILHPMLEMPLEELVERNADAWDSSHPSGYFYWRNAEALLRSGMHERFQSRFTSIYHLAATADDPELYAYITWVMDEIRGTGRRPVLCLERSEGILPWLRSHFPEALHIGLVRERDAVYRSWLEQGLLGAWGFFEAAQSAILSDPEYFGQVVDADDVRLLQAGALRRIFDVYNASTESVRHNDMDLSVTVVEIGAEESSAGQERFAEFCGLSAAQRRDLAERLRQTRPALPAVKRLERMVDASGKSRAELLAAQQRSDAYREARDYWHGRAEEANSGAAGIDELQARADELAGALQEARAELSMVYRSTSWRVTRPLRSVAATAKGARKRH